MNDGILNRILQEPEVPDEIRQKACEKLVIDYTIKQLEQLQLELSGDLPQGELTIQFYQKMYDFYRDELSEMSRKRFMSAHVTLLHAAVYYAVRLPDLLACLPWLNWMIGKCIRRQPRESLKMMENMATRLRIEVTGFFVEYMVFLSRYSFNLQHLERIADAVAVMRESYRFEVDLLGLTHKRSIAKLQRIIDICSKDDVPELERQALLEMVDCHLERDSLCESEQLPKWLGQIAATYGRQGRLSDGEAFFSTWIVRISTALGNDSRTLAQLMTTAAEFYHEYEMTDLAQQLDERIVHLWRRRVHVASANKSVRPQTLFDELLGLGAALATQHKYDEALLVYYEVTAKAEELFGPIHYETINANLELAIFMKTAEHSNYFPVLQILLDKMKSRERFFPEHFAVVCRLLVEYYKKHAELDKLSDTYENLLLVELELAIRKEKRFDVEMLDEFVRHCIHHQKLKEAHLFTEQTLKMAEDMNAETQLKAELLFYHVRVRMNSGQLMRIPRVMLVKLLDWLGRDFEKNHERIEQIKRLQERMK